LLFLLSGVAVVWGGEAAFGFVSGWQLRGYHPKQNKNLKKVSFPSSTAFFLSFTFLIIFWLCGVLGHPPDKPETNKGGTMAYSSFGAHPLGKIAAN